MAQDNFDELKSLLIELLTNRFAPKPEYTRGLLGDGLGNVVVPSRPDKNYVRFNRGSTEYFEVFNVQVPAVEDWPVLIGELPWLPGLTQVVGTDWAAYEQSGWGDNLGATSPHAPTHQWPDGSPGADPINVYLRSIVPLRAYSLGTGSTTIYVNSYEYENTNGSGTVWGGLPGVDMQPVMSSLATGTARLMGIYLNPGTNTLGVVTGASDIFTDASDPPPPQFPRGILPVARVRVYGGQASIGEVDIRDTRQPFGWIPTGTVGGTSGLAGGDLTGSYPSPQVAGLFGYPLLNTMPGEGDILMFTGSAWQPIPSQGIKQGANLVYNTLTHDISQTGYTFANFADDTYIGGDIWLGLHNGPGTAPTGNLVAGVGSDPFVRNLRLYANAASTQIAAVHFFEKEDTIPYRGKTLSLSAALRGNITNARMAILEWTGTADTITSDVVGTWGTGNPTLATNWAYCTTPSVDIAISGTLTRYAFENVTVGTSANNLAIMIWMPDSQTTNDYLDIANVKLELGATATDFVPRDFLGEFLEITRYAWNPNWKETNAQIWSDFSFRVATNQLDLIYHHPVPMLYAPNISVSGFDTTALGAGATSLGGYNYVTSGNLTSVGTISITAAFPFLRQSVIRVQAATSISGTQGDVCLGWMGPSVVCLFDARL